MLTSAEVYQMLGNTPLWQTALQVTQLLHTAEIPHAVVGGVAVCLHGYQRNTVDLDVLVSRQQQIETRQALIAGGFEWNAEAAEFTAPTGHPVHFLLTGDRAGKDSVLRLPDPQDSRHVQSLEGVPVVVLPRLIEMKIASGEGSLRRTHKDFADVIELIAQNELSGTFASQLHRSVRKTFRNLVRAATAE